MELKVCDEFAGNSLGVLISRIFSVQILQLSSRIENIHTENHTKPEPQQIKVSKQLFKRFQDWQMALISDRCQNRVALFSRPSDAVRTGLPLRETLQSFQEADIGT